MLRNILVKFSLLAPYSPYREKTMFTYGGLQILQNAYILQLVHFSVNSRISAKSIHNRLENICDHSLSCYLYNIMVIMVA